MTRTRCTVSASLAARGQPERWATEQEAAALSGYEVAEFRKVLPDLEMRGFPRANPINGKRRIEEIDKFWAGYKLPREPAQDQDAGPSVETLGVTGNNGRRLAS